MKKDILILIAAASLIGASVLRSQDASAPANPMAVLQAVKAANADLIDQQKKTLDGLDDTQKTADTIRTLGKRG
jgi:hypothetical protein